MMRPRQIAQVAAADRQNLNAFRGTAPAPVNFPVHSRLEVPNRIAPIPIAPSTATMRRRSFVDTVLAELIREIQCSNDSAAHLDQVKMIIRKVPVVLAASPRAD